jgi:hypothetical protein
VQQDGKTRANSPSEVTELYIYIYIWLLMYRKPSAIINTMIAQYFRPYIAEMEMRKLTETAEVQGYYCRGEPEHEQRSFRGVGDISRC